MRVIGRLFAVPPHFSDRRDRGGSVGRTSNYPRPAFENTTKTMPADGDTSFLGRQAMSISNGVFLTIDQGAVPAGNRRPQRGFEVEESDL